MRASPSDHYRQLHAEIWDGEDATADEMDGTRPHPVLTAIEKLGEQSDAIQHAVGTMVDAVSRSHENVTRAVEASEAAAVTKALDELKKAVASDSAALRKTMVSIQGAMGHLAARLDTMVGAMKAPRHVVYDNDGRPIGVRSGEPS